MLRPGLWKTWLCRPAAPALCRPECLEEKREEQEEVVESIEFRDDKPLTKQLRAAARSGKGTFLLMTFKEVFENITAGACRQSLAGRAALSGQQRCGLCAL